MILKAAFSWKEQLFLLVGMKNIFKIVWVKKLRENSLLYLLGILFIMYHSEYA